ncbi:MAG: adenosylcobinamide-GDP ribazoletransferase [Desulfobacteraceae bacterium]|nr:adenosylcobinamide-GDP ribazoletransferase [Desulfobacteraceae bacterium]
MKNMISGFLSAIQFLTIIPCGGRWQFDAERAIGFFPLTGLLIGVLLMLCDCIAMALWNPAAAAVIDVIALATISGALHLDGLADTADGLYGRRSPEKALDIMKDSRVGAIGMVVVICCLAAKWAGIYGLNDNRLLYLMIIPAFSRSAVILGMKFLPYGRPQGGTGHIFFKNEIQLKHFWGLALVSVLTIFAGRMLIIILLVFTLTISTILWGYHRRIGCITGDMLGALIELTETALFLILSVKGPI